MQLCFNINLFATFTRSLPLYETHGVASLRFAVKGSRSEWKKIIGRKNVSQLQRKLSTND